VLAAGESKRWGDDNKLLALVERAPMLRRTVEAVLAAATPKPGEPAAVQIGPIIVVTGNQADAIRAALTGLPVDFAHAVDFAQGMSASLKTGIVATPANCDGALICLGDMPFVNPATLRALAAAYDPERSVLALIPTCEGKRGNPVLIGRPLFPAIATLSGDQGARLLLADSPGRVRELACGDPGILRDLDRPEALAG
jgi:molybdenum cofactor cytidylyltransferase